MMLRLKLLLPLLLLFSAFSLPLYLYWLPAERAEHRALFLRTQHAQLDTLATALTEPLLRGDLALVQSTIAGVEQSNPEWQKVELVDPEGQALYLALNKREIRADPGNTEQLSHPVAYLDKLLGTLRVQLDLSSLMAESDRTARNFAVAGLGLLLLVLAGGSLLFERLIYRPIERLTTAAGRLAKGDFDVELPGEGRNETGMLSTAFRSMRDSIRDYQERLRQALQASHANAERLSRQNELLAAVGETQRCHIMMEKVPCPTFDEALRLALRLTQSEYGFIGEAGQDADGVPSLRMIAACDAGAEKCMPKTGSEIANPGATLAGAALAADGPVIVNDPARDPRPPGLPEGHPPLTAFLGLPLVRGEKTVGVIGLVNRAGGYTRELADWLAPELLAIANLMEGCRLREEREAAAAALNSIVQGTAAVTGADFLRELVRHLAQGLGVRYALVGRLTPDSARIQTLAVWSGNGYAENFEYELAGTPCETMVGRKICSYPRDVRRLFPQDHALAEMGAESYAGAPLYTEKDTALGLLAVLDDKPLRNTEMLHSLMSAFASRAGAELERQETEQALRLAAGVFENTAEGILVTDADLRILAVNQSFTRITGYTRAEVLGQTPRLLKSGRQGAQFYESMWNMLKTAGQWQGEIWNRRKNGEIYVEWLNISAIRDDAGKPIQYVGVFSDITNIKKTQADYEYLASHDTLTDLPNRILFQDRLKGALHRARREGHGIAVLFLDIDRFKNINDSLGHALGDQLLKAAAARLSALLRSGDTVARLGGDEFVLILDQIREPRNAAVFAQKLLSAFDDPIMINGHVLHITVSVGISLYPDDGADVDVLVRNADAAMYRAKEEGRNGFQFYTEKLTRLASERLEMEAALRRAVDDREFRLLYQPQVSLATGEVLGAEALLRWLHPRMGLLTPDRFIPLAEETGLIVPIGEWTLREACARMKAWDTAGARMQFVAVNLSGLQIQRGRIVSLVTQVLLETGLDARHLELEITESLLMHKEEETIKVLRQLRELGISIAIDDFGTGYSSLSYLKRFQVNKLKIDKSFVRDIGQAADSEAIARAIIALGKSLQLKVIAEGVETVIQLGFLAREGCDEAQGFLYGKPMPAEDFERLFLAGPVPAHS